ncbi:NAD-dependent DNA ligase LigA [Butyrivibrio sp. TB]|uniref:NAD-dependent DNA ligase LigA n=1 Tax=Butyrivibrio sp. TB TaxID=1520809 RepID=UPI0008C82110|nr:NAD-dependent DNA ligase LigA [Butyrivibrio sp. TB]SEP91170.1 DNA ligase (NAD+) [Butyrivibrio sp. TB]
MGETNLIQEYNKLCETIKYHMDRYYNQDAPEISDYEYDQLMLQLKAVEKEHPELISKDSPTRIIGGSVKRTAGVTVEHDVPMLSIQDVFSKEEVLEWVHDVRAMHPDVRFCVEHKIDGLSMSIRYENGKLTLAETRGDGLIGEDVTSNAIVIPDVVRSISSEFNSLEVRGEVYMSHEDFDKTNRIQEAHGKKTFANPRNCAAGTLRQLDSGMVRERGLSMFIFNIQRSDPQIASHSEGLEKMKALKMAVVPSAVCVTDDEILAQIDAIGESRGSLPYDIDGAVIKIDQIAYRDDFPAGSKYSSGHIAYKYPPEEKEAVIKDIELSVGMTGRVNPTAVFSEVRLCGTTVSRATLHNQDFIDNLGIGIGRTVLVYKSGEIIPKIRSVVASKNPADSVTFKIPDVCPVCGGKVVREPDTADMICTNDDCPAKLERRIINFVGRDAMDIKGFGEEYIRTLIENGYLHDIADIYLLKDYRQELIEKGLIGKEKGTDNVLNAIEASKSNEPFRLLTGLSIPNVGKTSSKTIMKAFNSIDDLMHARVDQLVEVQDVGETTALCIHDFFHKDSNIRLLERLKEYGLTFDMEVVESSSELAGQTYVITGSLEKFANRDAMVAFIESHGGSVSGSVSKKTFALINNDIASNSGKNKKAKELGIPIITEEEFLSKVQS